jgi:hypothetical protein
VTNNLHMVGGAKFLALAIEFSTVLEIEAGRTLKCLRTGCRLMVKDGNVLCYFCFNK